MSTLGVFWLFFVVDFFFLTLLKVRFHIKLVLSVLNVLGNTLASCGRHVDSQRAF